ncbi:mitochondrial proton/calcium exchanger protein isoform X1 [Zootermopsis nevadensis]|uniref:Mitochondrial proton/calcium exchanger protein n=2 Tax=Zootermopsis nevadensis TaxID=136037 RepID=A0A067R7R2_ZOONE|nr:mitochondrial proton/calcium exchanger protein isoform X1 [Zootermopsis nevadensis]KDR19565.1 LETM1 and EF-hand domain-containing protein anon-60Da, mitochondrial [Zootermopsis nevadensis]
MHSVINCHKSIAVKTKSFVSGGCRCHQWNAVYAYKYGRRLYRPCQISCPVISTRLVSTIVSCNNGTLQNVIQLNVVRSVNSFIQDSTLLPFIPTNSCMVRHLYVGYQLYDKEPLKPSSKIEETVQALKEDLKDKPSVAVVAEKPPLLKRIKKKIVDEALHYYHGFRLLFIDINISRKLAWRVLNGKSLTRREHRLLVQTVSDLFRLVPFSVFIIVPFMELLLPVAIKLFPGMLPSTFQTATEKDQKMKQALKVKLEMAKFLQQTLDGMAVQGKGRSSEAAKEFAEFFVKVRTSGEQATNEEIMKFSKLFEDEITLDSLSRPQLMALCRVLEIQPIGTNNFLRFHLRMKVRSLAADDKAIQKEGIESLTPSELQQACRARGMRAYGMSEDVLRTQLAQWLELSLEKKVPPSLLLLSRALLLPDRIPASDQLKATISVLPDTVVTQTKAAIGEREGKIDNKTKIEIIKEEVRKIKEEHQEQKEEEKKEIEREEKEMLVDKAPIITQDDGVQPEILRATAVEEQPVIDLSRKEKELTTMDFEALEDALDTLSKDKKILVERELDDLKEELAEYQEDVDDLKKVVKVLDKSKSEVQESKAARRLFKKVNSMISKMDDVLEELEREEKKLIKDLEAKERLEGKETQQKSEELVSIEELKDAIKRIQKVPDDSLVDRISEVLAKMDIDKDGAIRLDDVLKVVELVGKENVKLNKKQIDDIIDLMSKEDLLELEEQIEKALEKGNQEKGETLKGKQSGKQEKEAVVKATVTAHDGRKKENDPSNDKSTSSNLAAISAAAPTQPPNVTEPVDKKDNSKTL